MRAARVLNMLFLTPPTGFDLTEFWTVYASSPDESDLRLSST